MSCGSPEFSNCSFEKCNLLNHFKSEKETSLRHWWSYNIAFDIIYLTESFARFCHFVKSQRTIYNNQRSAIHHKFGSILERLKNNDSVFWDSWEVSKFSCLYFNMISKFMVTWSTWTDFFTGAITETDLLIMIIASETSGLLHIPECFNIAPSCASRPSEQSVVDSRSGKISQSRWRVAAVPSEVSGGVSVAWSVPTTAYPACLPCHRHIIKLRQSENLRGNWFISAWRSSGQQPIRCSDNLCEPIRWCIEWHVRLTVLFRVHDGDASRTASWAWLGPVGQHMISSESYRTL